MKVKRYIISGFLVLMPILALTWTSLSFAIANLPAIFTDVEIRRDISYGEKPWQKLDLYSPAAAPSDAPVIVFFYGGRWTNGEKEKYKFVGLRFADLGYKVVIPDYSQYPEVKFPAFVEDGAKAVSWAYDQAGKEVYIVGHSAGAHIGALIASDPSYLKIFKKERSIIKSFAGMAGPYAFEPDEPDLKEMFGPPENYPLMQAPTFIDGSQPPMLLLHGEDDKDVMLFNLERLRDKIKAKGGVVQTKIYPDTGHIKILAALSWVLHDKTSVVDDIDTFFRKHETRT